MSILLILCFFISCACMPIFEWGILTLSNSTCKQSYVNFQPAPKAMTTKKKQQQQQIDCINFDEQKYQIFKFSSWKIHKHPIIHTQSALFMPFNILFQNQKKLPQNVPKLCPNFIKFNMSKKLMQNGISKKWNYKLET